MMMYSDVVATVYGPAEAERTLGTWGRKCNLVLICREDKDQDPVYQEIVNWIVESDACCRAMPVIEGQEFYCLMLLFQAFDLDPKKAQRINDDYMRFKMTFLGQGIAEWNDKNYVKCIHGSPV